MIQRRMVEDDRTTNSPCSSSTHTRKTSNQNFQKQEDVMEDFFYGSSLPSKRTIPDEQQQQQHPSPYQNSLDRHNQQQHQQHQNNTIHYQDYNHQVRHMQSDVPTPSLLCSNSSDMPAEDTTHIPPATAIVKNDSNSPLDLRPSNGIFDTLYSPPPSINSDAHCSRVNPQQPQQERGPPPAPYETYHSYNSTSSPECCCTFISPLHLLRSFLKSHNLHRSFCFGAIDGLLTGSGIAAAASGLGLFDPYSDLTPRLLIVGLSFATCVADGLCMGIGHVWSTYILQEGSKKERSKELLDFAHRRSESKARLVDALLMRGMLRIDAMSVADTLEGYP